MGETDSEDDYRQVVEMSVTVNNSPIQDYVHWDDQTQTKTSKKLSRVSYLSNIFSNDWTKDQNPSTSC